jgi:hypothetical protein
MLPMGTDGRFSRCLLGFYAESVELRYRYKKILQNGLSFKSFSYKQLMYCYFGSSASQMKKQEFWFMTPVNIDSVRAAAKVKEARIALGDLKKIKNIATHIARVGLYLTTSKPTDVNINYSDIYLHLYLYRSN